MFSIDATGSSTFAGTITSSVSGNYAFSTNGRGGLYNETDSSNSIYMRDGSEDYPSVVVYGSTGQIGLGPSTSSSNNIELNGADGSASFAGDVKVGGDATAQESGVHIDNAGYVQASCTSGAIFAGYTAGNSTSTSLINADGSASFAGSGAFGSATYSGINLSATSNNSGVTTIYARNYGTAGAPVLYITDSSGNQNARINNNGSAVFVGTVTATVVPPSDARFKENITPANPQLADVVALGGILKNYDWNEDAPVNEELRAVRQLGLIAQEAEAICPTIAKDIARTKQGAMLTPEETIPAVTEEVPDPLNEGKTTTVVVTPEQVIPATYEVLDDSYKGISNDALIMKLLGAITELKAEVDELKSTMP